MSDVPAFLNYRVPAPHRGISFGASVLLHLTGLLLVINLRLLPAPRALVPKPYHAIQLVTPLKPRENHQLP